MPRAYTERLLDGVYPAIDISTPLNVTAAVLRVTSERERNFAKRQALCIVRCALNRIPHAACLDLNLPES